MLLLSGEAPATLRVVIVGGSIGGLCAALALQGAGREIDVYERTPAQMTSRGAGIVVQADVLALLRRHGAPGLPTTRCSYRRYLTFDGRIGTEIPMVQRFTSWDAIYRTLRLAISDDCYHLGRTVTGFDQTNGEREIAVRFEHGEPAGVDLLVCADGWRSDARERLLPNVHPRYAGYVAWRGTLDEATTHQDLTAFFNDRFTFCEARSGGHALCYLIPGLGAAIAPGHRRLNWVWYVRVEAGVPLDQVLTDRRGERRAGSVPSGDLPAPLVAEIHAQASRELHPAFAALIGATPDLFVQAIFDLEVPRMVFGRVCLSGDAAFVVRPHTAGATAKAAADALALAHALSTNPERLDSALRHWERERLAAGVAMMQHGVALGNRLAIAR